MAAKNNNIWFWVLGIIAVAIIAWAVYGAGHITKSDDGYGVTTPTLGDQP